MNGQAWPESVFDPEHRPCVDLVDRSGAAWTLDTRRWHEHPSVADLDVLGRVEPAVLDVGCGPGRHLAALNRLGYEAVGIDSSPAAVHTARQRGGTVLAASVFDPLPDEGRWSTVLLLDGNIGIGGCPVTLLARCRALLHKGGRVLAELGPPSSGSARRSVRAVIRREISWLVGDWFDWATVAVDDVHDVAVAAGLIVADIWSVDGRWFSELLSCAVDEP